MSQTSSTGSKRTTVVQTKTRTKDGIDDRFDRCPSLPEDFVGLADGCPEKR